MRVVQSKRCDQTADLGPAGQGILRTDRCATQTNHLLQDLHPSVQLTHQSHPDFSVLQGRVTSLPERRIQPGRPPAMPDPQVFEANPPESLDLVRVAAVIFTTGFRPDYTSWVA